MTKQEIFDQIVKKQSVLCVGLDTARAKVPQFLIEKYPSPDKWMFEFNKKIIDATAAYSVAYKPNLAFYEAEGYLGMLALERTAEYIKHTYPEVFLIADAKRGDIGNTSQMYAEAYLERLPFDAITVAPYMGEDSVKPFLLPDKWVLLLALTSNKGSQDFQTAQKDGETYLLFEEVMYKSQKWATDERLMFVIGATNGALIKYAREAAPNHIFLVPGVGAQGGALEEVFKYGVTQDGLVIVNSSRGIIYAGDGDLFALAAGEAAREEQRKMAILLAEKDII